MCNVFILAVTKEAPQAEATVIGNTGMDIGTSVINWKSHKKFYKVPKVLQRRCEACHSTYHKGRDFYIVLSEKLGVEGKSSHQQDVHAPPPLN